MWRTLTGSALLLVLAATVAAYVRFGHPAKHHALMVAAIALAAIVGVSLLLWGVATRT